MCVVVSRSPNIHEDLFEKLFITKDFDMLQLEKFWKIRNKLYSKNGFSPDYLIHKKCIFQSARFSKFLNFPN